MELRLKYPPTPEYAPALAALCVDVARDVSKLTLDYGPESLRLVDRQLGKFNSEGLSSHQIASTLFCFGCYVGEVLIRNLGGRWADLENSPMSHFDGPPIVVVMNDGACWNPIGKVFKRVDDGEGESVEYLYRVADTNRTSTI